MKIVRVIARAIAAIAVLLIVPLLGILVAFLVAPLQPDPNFVANGGHASPGDGFLIMPYIVASLAISIPLSVLLAGIMLLWKPKSRMPLHGRIGTATSVNGH